MEKEMEDLLKIPGGREFLKNVASGKRKYSGIKPNIDSVKIEPGICPYTNEYCNDLSLSNTVCISCDTYIDSTDSVEDIKALQAFNKGYE